MDYLKTPSFYNNEEYFQKYLGKTSYYTNLQKVVSKIIQLVKPKNVLEMGSALGTTTCLLAQQYPSVHFWGSDIRKDIIDEANKLAKNTPNASFFTGDMCLLAQKKLQEYDLIYLLYSFHHILDPLENKLAFLKNCFSNMKKDSYLLIAETFLPDGISSLKHDESIHQLFNLRAEEGYASTYWESLEGLSSINLKLAKEVANFSKSEESLAGENVFERINEYLIEFSWLIRNASEVGFEVVIAEPVNALMEKAILLRK